MNLVVPQTGTFYGNCTNYDTVVYGSFSANTVVLEKNHQLAIHGPKQITFSLPLVDDESSPP